MAKLWWSEREMFTLKGILTFFPPFFSDHLPLLWGKTGTIGFVQPRKEKALEWPNCGFPAPEGATKMERDFLQNVNERTRGNGFKQRVGLY